MAANAEFASYKEGPTFQCSATVNQWSCVAMTGSQIVMTSATSDIAFSIACRAGAADAYIPVATIGSFVWVRTDGVGAVGAFMIPSGTTAGNLIGLGTITGSNVCYVGQMITATADTQLGILLLCPHMFAA
jgi:hypothetical protein